MSLLTFRSPVDYAAQQSKRPIPREPLGRDILLTDSIAAFEEFLLNYKSTQTDLEIAATDAFQNLDIDGDGTSDEYDFMDDVTGDKQTRNQNKQYKEPKRKYIDMLQKVADRQTDEVTIELDDLDNVHQSLIMLLSQC